MIDEMSLLTRALYCLSSSRFEVLGDQRHRLYEYALIRFLRCAQHT